jgi:hypothetical protein
MVHCVCLMEFLVRGFLCIVSSRKLAPLLQGKSSENDNVRIRKEFPLLFRERFISCLVRRTAVVNVGTGDWSQVLRIPWRCHNIYHPFKNALSREVSGILLTMHLSFVVLAERRNWELVYT